jgi:hypothetical protein
MSSAEQDLRSVDSPLVKEVLSPESYASPEKESIESVGSASKEEI